MICPGFAGLARLDRPVRNRQHMVGLPDVALPFEVLIAAGQASWILQVVSVPLICGSEWWRGRSTPEDRSILENPKNRRC